MINKSPDNRQPEFTYDELFTGLASGYFNHLRIFLHREHNKTKPEFGRKFLMVTPEYFGLVKLNDMMLEDHYIHLLIEDAFTGKFAPCTIDINDKSIQILMVAWEDVLEIINLDKNIPSAPDDLLEFIF